MRFRRHIASGKRALGLAAAALLICAMPARADMGTAVVPVSTIYPGDTITEAQVKEVEVTNPRLAGGYARSIGEVAGFVTKRTLIAGRTIPLASLREPYAIKRGGSVRLTSSFGALTISAAGTPLQDAMVGDVIRVRNLDSGVTVSGTVMADGTVEVMQK